MKSERHFVIIDLIENSIVNTQDDIIKHLKDKGFKVTQATVSRDIRELKLVKILGDDGKYRYSKPVNNAKNEFQKFYSLLNQAIICVDVAINIVVLKCYVGMAQAVCSALDSMCFKDVVGTIAGDDTVFLLFKSALKAKNFIEDFNEFLNN